MPSYSYRCNDCNELSLEWYDSYADRKDTIPCEKCGGTSEHDIVADHCGFRHNKQFRSESMALAVDIEDHEKTVAEDRAIGSEPSEWVRDGAVMKPVFTSLKQQRQYCRDRGMYDRDGFL